MGKSKVQERVLSTRIEAEELANRVAEALANRQRAEAEQKNAVAKVKEEFAPTLASTKAIVDKGTGPVRTWAVANSDEFGDKRSIVFSGSEIGFRLGSPKVVVKMANVEDDDFDPIVKAIKDMPASFRNLFLRVKVEVNLEAVAEAFRADNANAKHLRELGLAMAQDETFYIKPLGETTEPVSKLPS